MKLERSAGVLLHISSLPSAFGIGDLGPEAFVFADFLQRAGQTYWQLLPLNPTEEGQGHSPYSAISSWAGNTLFISPELLADDGLVNPHDLKRYHQTQAHKANYSAAQKVKAELFDLAWNAFNQSPATEPQQDFALFVQKENAWLHNFALFILLKNKHEGKPWYEWEDGYKNRKEQLLQQLEQDQKDELQKVKWLQFIFAKQWQSLKKYCNSKGLQLFGDLPFYTSYDSADVWSNRDIFCLDEHSERLGLAGVPPDAFSDEGQLWGMPVFKWDVLKTQGYTWWIDRLKKNMELFDLLRLDHFRAFADYWEVPAGSYSAKNGEWKQGPRSDFFKAIKAALGDLPFIAEDLGEIDQPVYDLRDEFHFAGMKILQFAFGYTMPSSPYIPHNYEHNFIVYTGTHDNNTVRGWYRQEGSHYHEQLDSYLGYETTEKNVHIAMSRLAYSSVANVAILPAQDLLGLDENARMNIPAGTNSNWVWRLLPGQLTSNIEMMLKEWTERYNR